MAALPSKTNFTLLQSVFQKYPELVFAYLFGSHAEETAKNGSDIDLAVYVTNPEAFSFSRKLQLHGDICRTLQYNDVDLVVLNQSNNLLLIEEILRKGQLIYNTSQALVDDFFVNKLHSAMDFRAQRKRNMGV